MESKPIIIRHIGQLLTMSGPGPNDAFACISHAALVVEKGLVVWAGADSGLPSQYQGIEIDGGGALVTPGLVDAHTHLIYAGHRAHEVRMRAQGRSYLEILQAGGGILSTVEKTRGASDQELLAATRKRLNHGLLSGTTTFEIKSGYDLTVDGELRLLRLINQLREEGPWRVIPTALAAHAVPPEFFGRPADYLRHLEREYLPKISPLAEVVDIFCEPGVFSLDDSRHYLQAAQARGLQVKLHVDELADGKGAWLAAAIGAQSADHCALTSGEAYGAMARAGVAAVILPGTARYLDHGHMANARAMLDHGGWVAIASDGNPGSSPTDSLGQLLPWAASWLKLTPEEVWTGVTRGGAQALRILQAGRLVAGAPADFILWDAEHYAYPTYYYGSNLVREVYVGGRRVAANRPEVI